MNTNRSASQRTQYNKAKAISTYHQTVVNNINAGNVVLVPGRYSDKSASIYTDIVVGQTECCVPDVAPAGPTYTTYYEIFTTTGAATWTAPAGVQSPITYWIVGGGGGGGGARDNAGAGGGGGGVAATGTYAVVAGASYAIVVGAGGAGGTGRGTNTVPPNQAGNETDGAVGTDSSIDVTNGGPVAAGGGEGFNSRKAPGGSGLGGGVSTGGNGGGGARGGGGGGGAAASGTNGAANVAGTGGSGVSFTIPGYNGGNVRVYGTGGNGGVNGGVGYVVGADGAVNTGAGGGGGSSASSQPPYADGDIKMGGNGGSGLVVIQYLA